MSDVPQGSLLLAAATSMLLASGLAVADVLDVPGDHPTIQAAIDAAQEGDTVLVAPGVHEVTQPIVFRGKRITVKSAAGAEATTVRMGTPAEPARASVFQFADEEPDGTVLEGFTITGGQGSVIMLPSGLSSQNGGGVLCGLRASPRIARNIFRGNGASLGGGVYCGVDSAPILFENVFTENHTSTGGAGSAIACDADTAVLVEGGTFTRNEASGGGAIFLGIGGSLQVAGARFEGNSAQIGGAVFSFGERLDLANCDFIANRSQFGGGVFAQVPLPGRLSMKRCRFEENTADSGGGALIDAFPIVNGIPQHPDISVEDSHFTGNRAALGGGLFVGAESDLMQFRRCRFERNSALLNGGGMYCEYDSQTLIEGCAFFRNRADQGGGIWLEEIISSRILNTVIAENAESGIAGEGVQVEIDHSTITGNSGIGAPVEFTLIESSIVWDNAGGSLSVQPVIDPLRLVARSIIDHRDPWPGAGNSNADPLFGGWASGPEVHVDAAAPPGGDGTRERPFRTIEEGLDGYDLGLLPGSPCIGAGKGGSDIGAQAGPARHAGVRSRVLRAAPGAYSIQWVTLAHQASIEGAGHGMTMLEGTLLGLRSGQSLSGASVTKGTLGGISVSPFESPRIERAAIQGNSGRLGGGVMALRGSSPSFTDSLILDNAAREGGGSGVFCEESSPAFTRCTFTGNASPFGGTISTTQFGAVSLTSSIVWGNSGPAFGEMRGAAEVTYSLIEGGVVAGIGNITGDPLFCGWGTDVVHVDASSPGPGAGTEADPHPTLARALRGFSVALAVGSPSIGTGKDGADMGAVAGTCDAPGYAAIKVRLAAGDYAAAGITLSHSASIEGRRWGETAIRGTILGLRSGATLSGVTVTGGTDGGILLADGESPEVEDVALSENWGPKVSVISVRKGSPRFTNLLVTGNFGGGGPMILLDRASPHILNSTFANNQIAGPWIFCEASSPVVRNCIFWTLGVPFLQFSPGSQPVVTHCLTSTERFPGEGNINLDPRFVAWPDDLRLLFDSPCIDTGLGVAAPPTDIDGQARPCWSGVDMGAHEYCGDEIPRNTNPFQRGDTNSDGQINITDAVLALLYLFSGEAIPCLRSADVDNNSLVDLTDSIFLLNHLFQGGGQPPEPFVSCGIDPIPDGLTCERSSCNAPGPP